MEEKAQEQEIRVITDDISLTSFIDNEDVFVPLLFDPTDNPHKPSSSIVQFKAKELRFLKAFDHNTPINEAAEKAGISVEQAKRFLSKPDTRAWIWDCAQKNEISTYWLNPTNCIAEGAKIFSGHSVKNEAQMKVWKEFIDRALPKLTRASGNESSTTIQINIDPGAVQEAFRRQRAIDAEVSCETK